MSRADTGINDTGIIESEWVYTGPAFARSHPIAQHLGAVWLVVAWVALQFVIVVAGAVEALSHLSAGHGLAFGLLALLLFVLALNNLLALFGLVTRNTVAWYPVWLSLICGVLLTIPLMFYWGGGLRPNLIYRHRFGRLVWPATTSPT